MKLTHICAVITGAARGIGFATASRLIQEGARVVLADIDETTLNTALERLNSPLATAAIADVAKPQDCANLVAIAQSSGMHLNLWINNAGLARHRPICEYSEHEIDLMLSVNLKGTILGSQAALRAMSANRAGHIINALRVSPEAIEQGANALQKHREKPLLLYCETGASCLKPIRTLRKAGFARVYRLQGGLAAWRTENLPLQ